MPGFTDKTGGLIIDDLWKKTDYNPDGPYLIFTYEKNWDGFVKALREKIINDDVTGNDESADAKKILLAPGRGKKSFLDSYTRFIKSLPAGDSLPEKSSIPAAGESSYNSSVSAPLTQLDFMIRPACPPRSLWGTGCAAPGTWHRRESCSNTAGWEWSSCLRWACPPVSMRWSAPWRGRCGS